MTKAPSPSRAPDDDALLCACGFPFEDERAAIIALSEEEGYHNDVSRLIRRAVRGYDRKRLAEIVSALDV